MKPKKPKKLSTCPECFFEDGKHSFECSHYKPSELEKEYLEKFKRETYDNRNGD